jgi:hypothetical protein
VLSARTAKSGNRRGHVKKHPRDGDIAAAIHAPEPMQTPSSRDFGHRNPPNDKE